MKNFFKLAQVYPATQFMLEQSIKNNTRFYYISAFAWVGFFLYALAYRDGWLLLDSIIFLICTIAFMLVRKIDSMRLELMLK